MYILAGGGMLQLTPEEEHIYAQLFSYADSDRQGALHGQKAVQFLQKSKLPASVLGEIWQLADYEDRGVLSQAQFNIALKLIALAQDGRSATIGNLNAEASLPIFGDLYLEPYDTSDQKRNLLNVPTPLPPSSLPAGPSSVGVMISTPSGSAMQSPSLRPAMASPLPSINDPIGPEARSKFARMFASCQPVTGELDGERAKAIFMKSKLPMEKLGQIWTLADTHNRGRLDVHEFTIAMYLIQHTMDGSLKQLPGKLPNGFYPGTPLTTPTSASTPVPNSMSGSPAVHPVSVGTLSRYHTPSERSIASGSMTMSRAVSNQNNETRPGIFPPDTSANTNNMAWDVTPEQQSTFGRYFDGLDPGKRGFIGGDEAVRFFLNSKLPENVLAHIWDLADVKKSGRLTQDEFAVAMHLIHRQLRGQALPPTLPNSLIPPSMRTTSSTPVLGPFDPNLFQGNSGSATMPVRRGSNVPMPISDPFNTNDMAFASNAIRRGSIPAPAKPNYPEALMDLFSTPIEPMSATQTKSPEPMGDLFDIHAEDIIVDEKGKQPATTVSTSPSLNMNDNTGATANEADSKFADIRRLQREIAEQQRENEVIKQQRAVEEADAQKIAIERRDLSVQLAQLKSLYAAESKTLNEIRTSFAADTKQLEQERTEVMDAEHELLLARKEKSDLEAQLLRDREESADIRKRLRDANEELERLRTDLVGIRKDARLASALLDANRQSIDKAEKEKEQLRDGIGLGISSPAQSAVSAPNFDDPFAGFEDSFKGTSPRALSDSAKEPDNTGINAFDLAAAFGDPVEIAAAVPLPLSHKSSPGTGSNAGTGPSASANLFSASSSKPVPSMLRTETLPNEFDALFGDMDQPASASTTSSRNTVRKPFDFDTAFKNADFGFDTFSTPPTSTPTSTKITGRRPAPSPPGSRRSIASASLPGSDIVDGSEKGSEWAIVPPANKSASDEPVPKRSGSVTIEDTDNDFESRFPALPGGLPSTLPVDSSVLLESPSHGSAIQPHSKEDVDKAFDLPGAKDDTPLGFEDAFGDIKS
ncbi:hypothetical protein BDF19DRAFT_442049 [Syncephalis fuscata]|nr:hypothetical protein BDF19DRAFT_442049 [Syncephalis fuscata]